MTESHRKLPRNFYLKDDVVALSKALLGKVLCTQIEEEPLTSGIIVETEAYCGRNDKACHANNGLRTGRTEVMYQPGGLAYIYLCYGIHHLFNVVTNVKDKADAILIRAIEPVDGKETILYRRKRAAKSGSYSRAGTPYSSAWNINRFKRNRSYRTYDLD